MDAKKCIFTRRSIRKYKDKDVSKELVKKIIEYALHAPSSCNYQNWEFIVVKKRELKQKLSEVHNFCSFVKDASVIIVVCYDAKKCDYVPSSMVNAAVAAQNILLGLNNEGLGGCWVYVKDDKETEIEEKVKNYLNIPEHIEVLCMISLGYPDEEPHEKEIRKIDEVTHFERW